MFFEHFYSEDLMPFGVMVVVNQATATGNTRIYGCMMRRFHYFPKTFLT
uniref:Uncharacterized protein n=1 Tax=uncultured Desulfobacterium sp. TaxID=201089 RepID=E1YBE8_9BACT|nr:unknown protein [uncultured Desulfobacterium sp.]